MILESPHGLMIVCL
jgi:hypothetical protein